MKNKFKIMASVLTIAVFAAVTVSCEKEDDNDLIGRWLFQRGSATLYLDGEPIDIDISQSYFSEFRGLYFEFEKSGEILAGMGGQSGSMGSYKVSGDKVTINDGETRTTFKYRISGTTLDLIWSRAALELVMGALPDEFYEFDDMEFILTFTKVD
jgi:hypothetical protein